MMHFSFNIEHKIIPDYWDDFIFYEAMEYILIKKKTSYEIFKFFNYSAVFTATSPETLNWLAASNALYASNCS